MKKQESLRDKVVSGVIWKFAESILAQMVTFVVSIVLARLLTPDDYGQIALVMIFITLADTFVESGFGNALIQKKDADNTDFSTVFFFSLAASIGFYIVLFLCAPLVAAFYKAPILCPVLRVLALKLPLAGINTVQNAYVSRKMIFKRFFWATLGGTIASAVVGIIMAYMGFGIWSIVGQYLTNSTIDTLVLWLTVRWRPQRTFSIERLKALFSYGWKLLCAGLLYNAYQEFRALVIGRVYSSADLAYYNRGKQFPQLVVNNVNASITTAMFPAIAKVQDDKVRVKQQVRVIIRVGSYLMWPAMMGLVCVAKPLTIVLLTEKWLPCVIYMQITCFCLVLQPVQQANLQAIKAMGRSDLSLKMEITKRVVSIALVLIFMRVSVLAIALANIADMIFATIVNTSPNRRLLNYTYREQIGDLLQPIVMSLIMAVPVYCINFLMIPNIPKMILQVALGGIIYLAESIIAKADGYIYVLNILKSLLIKAKKSA